MNPDMTCQVVAMLGVPIAGTIQRHSMVMKLLTPKQKRFVKLALADVA